MEENFEKFVSEKESVINALVENVKVLEEKLEIMTIDKENMSNKEVCVIENFRCKECDFESSSKKGLKVHETRKHGQKFKCDLCEKSFDTEREKKVHRHTHSFQVDQENTKVQKCKCNKCDYTCNEVENMEIHVGKCCYEKPMCGLCDENFNDVETLEIHLNTCEIYECGNCDQRSKLLSDIKKHIKEEDINCQYFWHMKMKREDKTKAEWKKYYLSDI